MSQARLKLRQIRLELQRVKARRERRRALLVALAILGSTALAVFGALSIWG